jgi:CRP-like cAMP-binding protein
MKKSKRNQNESSGLLPYVKEVSFFKDQEVQNKDYVDVCELLTYEHRKEGEVLYTFGEPKDCMYIVIDGRVDFTVHMGDEVLTA